MSIQDPPYTGDGSSSLSDHYEQACKVALIFVKQYYTMLHDDSSQLHRFYQGNSSYVYGNNNCGTGRAALGQQEIQSEIEKIGFREVHAVIKQIDAIPTIGNGILIQVTGELSNSGYPMRAFVQSFVLEPTGSKKYTIISDIFRYQEDDDCAVDDIQQEYEDISSMEIMSKENGQLAPNDDFEDAHSQPSMELMDSQNTIQTNGLYGNDDYELSDTHASEENNALIADTAISNNTTPITIIPTTATDNNINSASIDAAMQGMDNDNPVLFNDTASKPHTDTPMPTTDTPIPTTDTPIPTKITTIPTTDTTIPTNITHVPITDDTVEEVHNSWGANNNNNNNIAHNTDDNTDMRFLLDERKEPEGQEHVDSTLSNNNSSTIDTTTAANDMITTNTTTITPIPTTDNSMDSANNSNSSSQERISYAMASSKNVRGQPTQITEPKFANNIRYTKPKQRATVSNTRVYVGTNINNASNERTVNTANNNINANKKYGDYKFRSQEGATHDFTNRSAPDCLQLFVGGLPKDCSNEDLKNCFNSFGTVTDVRVTANNFGFVVFQNESSVNEIIEITENDRSAFQIRNHPIRIERKQSQPPKMDRNTNNYNNYNNYNNNNSNNNYNDKKFTAPKVVKVVKQEVMKQSTVRQQKSNN